MRIVVFIPLLVLVVIDAIFASEQQQSCQSDECLYKNQCHKKGIDNIWEEVDEENGIRLKLFCTKWGESKLRIRSAECEYKGVQVSNKDKWKLFAEPHCTRVRCQIQRKTLTVRKLVEFTGCPYNGICRARNDKWNETVNSFIVTKKCIIRGGRKQAHVRTAYGYCPTGGGYIGSGNKWEDTDSCVKYRCNLRRNQNMVRLDGRKYGCPYQGECKPRGKWNDTSNPDFIFTYRCRFNKTSSRVKAVSAFCRKGDDTYARNRGRWKDLERCQRRTCQFNRDTLTVSVPSESLGCNVVGHGCIENGKTAKVNYNGKEVNIKCEDFKATFTSSTLDDGDNTDFMSRKEDNVVLG